MLKSKRDSTITKIMSLWMAMGILVTSLGITASSAAAPANLAKNKGVTASSTYSSYGASNAADGNGTTRWSSNFSDAQWIYVDLGTAQNVNRVVLNWEGAYAKAYKIQVSTDASSWTDVYTTSAGSGGVEQVIFTSVNARYVRMYGISRATAYGYSLWELEVYASDTQPTAPSGLVAAWSFDEGTGTTAADYVGGFNGAVSNCAWVNGRYGKALDFNGTNSKVSIAPIIGTYDAFTVSMWVSIRSYKNNLNALIASNGYESGDVQFNLQKSDKNMTVSIVGLQTGEDPNYGNSYSPVNSLGAERLGSWHLVTTTYNMAKNQISFYMDGALQKVATTKSSRSAILGAMQIGTWDYDATRSFDGQIDNVQIYSRDLTADEVGKLYCSGNLPAIVSAATSKSNSSVYKKNEAATATISISRLDTAVTGRSLQVAIRDVNKNAVSQQNLAVTPNAGGNWSASISLPTGNLGYFYVTAQLSTGEGLAKVGSRPDGILPYIVVVDPALRTAPTENSFFGMEGPLHSSVLDFKQYLGTNWEQTFAYEWSAMEPNSSGEFAAKVAAGQIPAPDPNKFEIFVCQTFPKWAMADQNSSYGALTSAGQTAYYNFYYALGQFIAQKLPSRTRHVYQIGWEPVAPWHWSGTSADIVTMVRLAYQALHAADPKAFVIAPTYAGIDGSHLNWVDELFQLGLGNYFDGYSNHAYVALPPEQNNFKSYIDQTRSKIQYYTGRSTEIWGTEQGVSTRDDHALEFTTAAELIRANLIALGEGFKQNHAFYVNDYTNEPGFGFFHNLDPVTYPWASGIISPKPVAAAYANMTYLLEGCVSTGAISGLPTGAMGYSYTDWYGKNYKVVWDYSGANQTASIYVGTATAAVYDWMGNSQTVSTAGGSLSISLSKNPQYIKY